jgi:D-galactose 1-dehydrogenase
MINSAASIKCAFTTEAVEPLRFMNQPPIKIGIVGLGKIARDQHIPALRADSNYEFVAVATRHGGAPIEVQTFPSLGDMIDGSPELKAVSFCTPPQGRYLLARQALEKGLHVMLEKPPGTTIREVEDLVSSAHSRGVALFASWHSRMAPAVDSARRWLEGRSIRKVIVRWKEDVRKWHPGQHWIWQPGGLGVFDPGINALSVITRILPRSIFIVEASLSYPANRDTPIAARLALSDSTGMIIDAEFDFRQTGEQTWDIIVDTDAGELKLRHGGSTMQVNEQAVDIPPSSEYPSLYRQFAELIRTGKTDVDLVPFQLVADAFLLGRREIVGPFND